MIVLPRVLAQSIDALVSVFIGFLTGFLLFHYHMPMNAILPSILVIIIATLSAMGMGLLIGAFALLTRDINMLLNISSLTLIALTGSNFHIHLLPEYLQKISWCLPLTRSIQLMRLLAIGETLSENKHLLFGELGIGIAFFILGMSIFYIIEKMSLKKATLDLY